MHADPDLARAEAAEKARERGVFVGRSDEHGTKTMYIKAAAGAVIRNDATLAAIAEALKTFGDTRPVQHRRADAVGIIADPRYTQELLTQARHHRLTTPAPPTPAPDTTAPDTTPRTPPRTSATAPAPPPGTAAQPGPPLRTPPARAPPIRRHRAEPPPDAGAPRRRRPSPTRDRPADRPAPGRRPPLDRATGIAAPAATVRPGADPASGWDDEDLLDDREPSDLGRARPGRRGRPRRTPPQHQRPARPPRHPRHRADRTLRPLDPGLHLDPDDGEPLDAAARRALHARLAQIKHDAYTNPPPDRRRPHGAPGGRLRPGQTEIYVHLTDHTLATGTGVLRAEGLGPLLADQLAELVGHGPYTVKPVIDLNDAVSVDAYEIPDRIRERVKLTHPVELFPFGTQETHRGMDLDHIQPYDPLGPPGQTSTQNLAPLGRFGHRVKTHAHGWKVRRLDHKTLEWTTPHGFPFHVDPTGTHRVPAPRQAADPG